MSDEIIRNNRRGQSKVVLDTQPQYQALNIAPIPGLPATGILPNVNPSIAKQPVSTSTHSFVSSDIDSVPNTLPTQEDNFNLAIGDFLLLVQGKIITTGNLDKIEAEIEKIIYGDNDTINNLDIHEDVVVLKRVPIKIGVSVRD